MKNKMKPSIFILSTLIFAIGFILGQQFQTGAINLDSLLEAQMDSVRNSYLKGCVDGSINQDPDFPDCVKMATKHEKEIRDIMSQEVETNYGKF